MQKEVEMPWKGKMPLGAAIINAPVKWLTTYRMQLFLYLKMNGRPELATGDAWRLTAPASRSIGLLSILPQENLVFETFQFSFFGYCLCYLIMGIACFPFWLYLWYQ
jgi:hypothetical protein